MVHQEKPQRMLRLFCCTIPFGTDSHFAQAGSEQCTPRAAYNRTSGFAKQNGGLTGRQADRTEFLTRPLMVHQRMPYTKV